MKLRQGETLSGILKPLILLTSPSTWAQTFAKGTLIGDSPPRFCAAPHVTSKEATVDHSI